MAEKYDIGIAGLGVMGQSLALNLERNGYSVAGYDTDGSKKDELKKRFKSKNHIADSLPDLISAIEIPRKLMMLVPAGKPVDALIHDLKPLLSENDVVIDGGNSFFEDTERRCEAFKGSGVNFIGAGISGGEEGALKGPCIMMGGSEEAYRLLEKIFTKISAHVGEEPCCDHVGTGGAGHFVKMVHNAIEYGDMQVICEAYYVLTQIFGLQASEVESIFESWNEGELGSYLMEISSEILGIADPSTNKPLIDVILDSAEQKGTGKWSIQTALDLGVAVPTLSAAVDARMVSSQKKDRTVLSTILNGPPAP